MKTTVYYEVSMGYGHCLGILKNFKKFSEAYDFAIKSAEDLDNKDITLTEICWIKKGLFKKAILEEKIIYIFND